MLLIGKAVNEGSRALAYWVGMQQDIAAKHEDEKTRQKADDFVALMTPILKAYQTDMGTEIANLAMQCFGGHGYIREWGVEQYVRDVRIAQIYEGTNGIQALDLIGRKMAQHFGRYLRSFFHPAQELIEEHQGNSDLQDYIFPFAKAFMKLQQATAMVAQKSLKNPDEAGAASSDFLRQFALVAMAFMWCKIVIVAQEKIEKGEGDKAFYEAKLKTAAFFMQRILPEADARFKMVLAGADTMMAHTEDEF